MMSSRTSLRIVLSTLLLIAVLSVTFAEQPLFRFVQISDAQPISEEMWANTAKAVELINNLQPQPAFVLFGGDLTHLGERADVERIAAICANLQAPLYPVPGNHDHNSVVTGRYQKHFGPEHWSMRYGNFKFVALNTPGGSAPYFMDGSNPEFVQWVDQELGDPTTPNRFVIGHYELWDYNPDTSWLSSIIDHGGGPAWLQELFDKHQVIAYLHGNDHQFRHGYPQGSDTLNASSWTVGDGHGFLGVDVYPLQAKLLKYDLQGGVEEVRTIALTAEAKLPGPTPMMPWPGAVEMEAILAP